MLDLKISGGTVLDGAGAPSIRADVGITDGRIADIGDLSAAPARRLLDAAGRMVCPGFIDTHSHSDAYLLLEPSAAGKIYQGVTTEVIGNCGASAAPRTPQARMPSDWQPFSYPGRWSTVAEYRRLLEQVKPAVNVFALAGHNTLRASVMGYEGRAAGAEELRAMERMLEQAFDEGIRGLSTGLIYPPGLYASTGEVQALAALAGRLGGIYTSHMRSEGAGLLDAIRETLAVGETSGARIQISHLKTAGRSNWGLIDEALALIESARSDGVEVAADRYPYTSSCTELDAIFPPWATEGGHEAELGRLRDPATRAKLREELIRSRTDDYWQTVTIGSTTPPNARFRGMPLTRAANALGMEPVDALLFLIESDDLSTSGFFHGMSEENLWKILAKPWVMIGSDASVRAPWGPLSHDFPHPRAYGSFPRFLRAALEGRTVALPEAIRKITSLPAAHFGMRGRGSLKKGLRADVVVFDPGMLADRATYTNPHQLAAGVVHVVVNGAPELVDGDLTGTRAGAWL